MQNLTQERINEVRNDVNNLKPSSAWEKGVFEYMNEILDTLRDSLKYNSISIDRDDLLKNALNGADSWNHYSWSGCSLAYNEDIAQALLSPSMYKKYRYSSSCKGEEFLDMQARALTQAFRRVWWRLSH